MQLFLVVLGGRSHGCHIEQHDVRFVAGETIDHTLPELRRQWFGLQRGLHLDSWQRIETVEGWRVALRPAPSLGPMRLWFVNVGAYDPGCMAELHAFGLFVATSAASAKAKAKRQLLVGAAQQHKDDLHPVEPTGAAGSSHQASLPLGGTGEVDDLLELQRLGSWQVHLLPPEPGADTRWQPLRPDWFGYRRIDRPEPPA
jgi:hypothetical protein